MIAALLVLAVAGAPSSDPGYRFAVALANAGPRPAGSAAERRAHARVEQRFRAANLCGRRQVAGVWRAGSSRPAAAPSAG